MAKGDDDYIVSEYGNWNVAAEYSKLKIMKPLYLADEYQTIATFGTLDFIDGFNPNVDVDSLKIKAFERLTFTLLLLIDNTTFAIPEKKREESKLKELREEIDRFRKAIPRLYKRTKDQRTKTATIKLNENYDKALERIIQIKALINEPLNKADLIFTHREEFDYNKFKEAKIKEFTEMG